MELQKYDNIEQSIAEREKSASELYTDIRIALYRKNIKVQDIAKIVNVSKPSVTRTIQGKQWNKFVVQWVKDNLEIILPPIRTFHVKLKQSIRIKNQKDLNSKLKKYFTPREVSFYYGFSTKYLSQQRYYKTGIPYRKFSAKVLYEKEDIENFIKTHSVKIKVKE